MDRLGKVFLDSAGRDANCSFVFLASHRLYQRMRYRSLYRCCAGIGKLRVLVAGRGLGGGRRDTQSAFYLIRHGRLEEA